MRLLKESDEAVRKALDVLRNGGVVAHATETCYGFACDLTNPAAVAKLFTVKQRPADQPVSTLFPSVEEVKKYAVWNDRAKELAKKYLPGPLTLILPLRSDAPCKLFLTQQQTTHNPSSPATAVSSGQASKRANERVPANQLTIGIRVSSNSLAARLAQEFGKPLSTTSANLHSQPNPYSAQDIIAQFNGAGLRPDLILDSGTLPETPASTVIDLTENEGKRLREGLIE
ncbi:MAG: L-threonylcarbamoyladenylate synthase [Candidatus Peribacteraceae bacterium]